MGAFDFEKKKKKKQGIGANRHILTREDRVKGGKSRSEAKLRALRINALKTGRDCKDPFVKKIITPTPAERLMGVTVSDKIKELRKLNKMFGSQDKFEYYYGLQEFLGEMVLEAVKRKEQNKSTSYIWKDIVRLSIELGDRLFGKPIDTQVNVQQNTIQSNTGKFSFDDLHKKVIERVQESEEWKKAEENNGD